MYCTAYKRNIFLTVLLEAYVYVLVSDYFLNVYACIKSVVNYLQGANRQLSRLLALHPWKVERGMKSLSDIFSYSSELCNAKC